LLRRPPENNPRKFFSIGLTHRCQCKCTWCATGLYKKDVEGEFTTEEVRNLLKQIADSQYVFDNVSFMGGECLLRKDIYPLVRYASHLGLFVHLSTNGLKLNDQSVCGFLECGLNSVFVSFPAVLPENGKARRQLDRVVDGVRSCVRNGLPCFFSVCVCRDDVLSGNLERTIVFAKEIGAVGVRLMPVRLSGRWLWEKNDKILTEQEEWKLRSLCRSGFVFITDDCSRQLGAKCLTVDQRIVYVSPYGEVQPCHFFPFSFGNVRENRLDSILSRMWSHDITRGDGNVCLLHDDRFRTRNIAPIDKGTQLPISV
jgi:MoaA/NifB/PqqE/SkfB family radical SAM enzyme